jgi:hypothetical protein
MCFAFSGLSNSMTTNPRESLRAKLSMNAWAPIPGFQLMVTVLSLSQSRLIHSVHECSIAGRA